MSRGVFFFPHFVILFVEQKWPKVVTSVLFHRKVCAECNEGEPNFPSSLTEAKEDFSVWFSVDSCSSIFRFTSGGGLEVYSCCQLKCVDSVYDTAGCEPDFSCPPF